MHRLDRERHRLGGRLRHRLAGHGGADAADDLEQPGAAGIDDPGLLEHGEQLRGARERLLAAGDDRG